MARPRVRNVFVFAWKMDHSHLLVVCVRVLDPIPQDHLAPVAGMAHSLGGDVGLPVVHV